MSLISGLLADFLSYVKDNLILIILCVVCIAAIVAILVILSVTSKKAKKKQAAEKAAENNSAPAQESLPESLPQPAEEPVEETHEIPAPVQDADETKSDPVDENRTDAAAEPEQTLTEPANDSETDTVVIVEPSAEQPQETEEKREESPAIPPAATEEKVKQPPKKKIVVTTRHEKAAQKTTADTPRPADTDTAVPEQKNEEPEVIEIVPAPKVVDEPEEDVIEIVAPPAESELPATTEEKTEEATKEPVAEETGIAASTKEETMINDRKKPQYKGKWVFTQVIAKNEAGEVKECDFFFQLKASNGETLISSEEYTSLRGANQGVDTFKANIARNNFKIAVSKKGKYVIKLLTGQGSLLAQGAHYGNRAAAQSGIASIRRFASTAVKQDEVQIIELPYEESPIEAPKDYDPDKKGKWIIRKAVAEDGSEESYYFELRASNGQLLFTSEEYTTLNGAKSGIVTHKANIAAGNIRPVITRNGDYVLKIYAGNGQLLCLGEHYSTKQLCQSAVESVKRFAETAESVEETTEEES